VKILALTGAQCCKLFGVNFFRSFEVEFCKLVTVSFCRLKLFVPMMIWGAVVLVPLNMTDDRLKTYGPLDGKRFSKFDELSIANVEDFSKW
jgi:hypothetical protein